MSLTLRDKKEMIDSLGYEVDSEDWTHIKEMLEQIRTDKPKYDILYWSDKNKCGYIIRANKNNLK